MFKKLIVGVIMLVVLGFWGGTAGAGELDTDSQPAKTPNQQLTETKKNQTNRQTIDTPSAKYPPYPNVWGYEFPLGHPKTRVLLMSVHEAPGGEYAIRYVPFAYMKDGKVYHKEDGIHFFSGKKVNKKDLKKYFEQSASGNTALRREIKFDNKTSWESDTTCLVCCPYLSQHPLTKYSPTRTDEHLSVIYFSEKPIRLYYTKPFDKCMDKGAWQKFDDDFYYTQVFATIPYFVPLKDGTFLLYDSIGNFIIRLDKNFNSKSDLLNKKVFIVNTADINAIENRLFDADIFNRQTYDTTVAVYIKALKNGLQRDTALKEALDSINLIKKEGKTNDN